MSALAQPTGELQPEFWLRQLCQAAQAGRSVLSSDLGLGAEWAERLAPLYSGSPALMVAQSPAQKLLALRIEQSPDELADLVALLRQYQIDSDWPLAAILARGCFGFSHLWEDLGLASRAQLRELIGCWFPPLLEMNRNNMRWKKFFYRQLCEQGGDYLCRAPSCQECPERPQCFE